MEKGTTKNLCNSCLKLIPDESTKCPFCGSVVEVKQPIVTERSRISLSKRIGDLLVVTGILTAIFLAFGMVVSVAFHGSVGVGLLIGGLSMAFICPGIGYFFHPGQRFHRRTLMGPFAISWKRAFPPAKSSVEKETIEVEYTGPHDGFVAAAVLGLIIFFVSFFMI